MLRECRRVLKPGGRLGVLVIEAAPGLTAEQCETAVDLGPSSVLAEAPLDVMVRQVGLHVSQAVDVTDDFARTVQVVTEALEAEEAGLRSAEGAEAYEIEVEKKRRMAQGIAQGVLKRTLVVARLSDTRP